MKLKQITVFWNFVNRMGVKLTEEGQKELEKSGHTLTGETFMINAIRDSGNTVDIWDGEDVLEDVSIEYLDI